MKKTPREAGAQQDVYDGHDDWAGVDFGRRDFLRDAAAFAALASASGLALGQGAAQPKRGGNLNVGFPADPRIYNGFVYENSPQYAVMHHVMSKLLWWDYNGKLVGDLAEKWTQSKDGKQITFNLRKNVKWHDGKPFSADDVVWSLETVAKTALSFGKYLAKMTEVKALNPNTVRVTFSQSTPAGMWAYYVGSNVILPKHIFEGTDIKNNPANTAMIGTGPFKWKQYSRDESLVLERNPNYHGPAPYLDSLTFKFTPNAATAILQLQSGAIDLISNLRNLGVNDLVNLSTDARYQIVRLNATVVLRLSFNFRQEAVAKAKWLSDVRVRSAIAHAIDRETICNKLMHGYMLPSWGPFARASTVYDTKLAGPKFDPERANALLDEAGLKRGPDGVRFATDMAYVPYFGTDAVSPAIADMLGKVGIRINLVTADYQAFLSKYWLGPNGQADMPLAMIIGITAPNGDDCRPNYDSRYQPRNNGNGLSIPEVDKLFDEGQVETNPAKQKAIYGRLAKVLSDEVVNVWIGTYTAPFVASKRVQNTKTLGSWDVLQRYNELWLQA